MEWFKLSKPRASVGTAVRADGMTPGPMTPKPMAPEPPRPAQVLASLPVPMPAKSPKAIFDSIADEPRLVRPVPAKKVGFTISSSKGGESAEVQLTSPTLTVARARMLFKSGWRVQVTNAAGRQFAPSEFDEILKFD